VLRFREPQVVRFYKVTGYPVTPLIFSGVCGLLIWSSINYARAVKPTSLLVLGIMLLAGLAVYGLTLLVQWLTAARLLRAAKSAAQTDPKP
jgi:hypothetical protein